jgi:16S rRNA (cytosine1402-N4)-methyltransferase
MSAVKPLKSMFEHAPVLLNEVLAFAKAAAPAFIVDCTVGGAGHARALLEALPHAKLLGMDRDEEALQAAAQNLAALGDRVELVHARFSELQQVVTSRGQPQMILADFGVSSHQVDTASRGFSFRFNGPLDMRMDPSRGLSAYDLLTDMSEKELIDVLQNLGEERYAKRLAFGILKAKPKTTGALAAIVRELVPKSKDGLDPSTRTFQALRMLVNDELGEIAAWLKSAPKIVAKDGLLLAISFHSLEDRAVKSAFRQLAQGCICPPKLPICKCGKMVEFEILTKKAVCATDQECARNSRARSAKLRVARRLV